MKESMTNTGEKTGGYSHGVLDLPVTEGFISEVGGRTFLDGKNAYNCAKILALMKFFGHRHEFLNADLVKAAGIGHNNVTKYVKAMEQAGILDIDRSEWVAKGFHSSYYYRIKDGCDSGIGNIVIFSYDLDGTPFGEAIEIYKATKGMEEMTGCDSVVWDKVLPGWCYTSPYWRLSYRFMNDSGAGRLYECDMAGRLVSHFCEAPVYKSGRIYHAFHRFPRVLRYNLEFEGSPLTELFDLHASFFTLLASMLIDKLPEDEFNDLFYTCFEGRLYDEVAAYTGIMKDAAKEQMQGWRNVWNMGVLHSRYAKICDFMENRFPAFTNIIYRWDKKVNEKGKKVKTLQQDLGEYETLVFSDFAKFLVDKYNVTPFLLHDAVYCSQADKAKLPEDINMVMKEWFLNKLTVK